MLLNIFRSKQPIALLFIFVFTLLVWLNPFASSQVYFDDSLNQMPLFILSKMLIVPGSIFSKIMGLVLVFSIGLLIIRLNVKYAFFAERSYLPAFIYPTLLIGFTNVHDYYSFLPAGVLFLFALDRLLETYKTDILSYKIFDAAFILGIATLFYFNAIFFLFFIWIVLIVLRPFYWREWVFSILGLLVPLFLTWSFYFLFNIQLPVIDISFGKKVELNFAWMYYVFFSAILLLILISSQFLLRSMGSKKVFTRRSYNLFLAVFLLSLILFFIFKTAAAEIMVIGSIPLTMIFSHYFLQAKSTRWMDIVFYIYLGTFILTQLIPVS